MAGPSQQPANPDKLATVVEDVVDVHARPTIFRSQTSPTADLPTLQPCSAGMKFGDYELIQEIGRGGMGVVFKSRQTGLGRIVALKMLLPGSLPSDDDLTRFRTEAEACARLQHPNIVAIHEVGEVDGKHFFSMDFIEGPSLAQRIKAGPLPGRDAALCMRTIARAIHHAHQHQVLHRDLKPSNILLDADDQPHVADFGLAKRLGVRDCRNTKTGALLGTPSYMAPEQASGNGQQVSLACDIYGLGAVLYELITGRPPFQSDTPLDTLLHVIERDPAPPRLLNPKVDRDLEAICLKCLEKDPKRRYASAEELAEDLDCYINGETIKARSISMLDRLSRTLDRSQHVREFRGWGNLVLIFGAIIFIEHVIVFIMTQFYSEHYPVRWIVLLRGGQFAIMGLVFWCYRKSQLLPTTPAERQLWSIWIGYLIASAVVIAAEWMLVANGVIEKHELAKFPILSALSGLAFFIMGSNYWGRCYAYGVFFFALCLIMPFKLAWAPLEFGFLWAFCLNDVGRYLRRLGREEQKTDRTV
jgi:serine/threonine protein kinase